MTEQIQDHIHSHIDVDAKAERRVDEIPQERFDAFAPQHSIEYESRLSRAAKQSGTRIGHAIWEGTGGRGAHSPSSRETRDQEREAVGLPPKYHKVTVSGSSSPSQQINVRKI